MHSMAYQLCSWDANKVIGSAGVCRTAPNTSLPRCKLRNSRLTEGDVVDELLNCARDGITTE